MVREQSIERLMPDWRPVLAGAAKRFAGMRQAADRDDARQDMAVGLVAAAATFDPDRGTFRSWAWRAMRREAVEQLRRKTSGRRHRPDGSPLPAVAFADDAVAAAARSLEPDPYVAAASRDGFERLVRPILDPDMAAVIRLRFDAGLGLADVARRVGLGESRVTQLTSQAIDIMRRHAEADGLAA